jgi:peptide deformylase
MKRLKRTEFGNPILRKIAKPVPKSMFGTKKLKELVQAMLFTMRRAPGVGLAASQVGIDLALVVMETKPNKIRPHVLPFPPQAIINPKITKRSGKTISDWEGCLSLFNVRAMVPRSERITVEYYDERGAKHVKEFSGFQARVFQHEIDHLSGVLYIDRVKDTKTYTTFREFKKLILKSGLKSK